jgi:phosphoglycolate phosphatase-like HAD superfamily hydrolase
MVFLQRLRDQSVTVFPGSPRYLQALRSAGPHMAVVSSSKNTTEVLEAAGLRDSFDAQAGGFGWIVGVDRLGRRDALLHHGADVVVGDVAELLADVENGADVRRTA